MKDENNLLSFDEILKKDLGFDSSLYKDQADFQRLNKLP